jgi:hypothetical protein
MSSYLLQEQQERLRGHARKDRSREICAANGSTTLSCAIRQALRELASKMYFLVLMRIALGRLARTTLVARISRTGGDWVRTICAATGPSRSMRHPYQWMSMDYVLTEGPPGLVYSGRGTFQKKNDPWNWVLRFWRRLAWGPAAHPVLVATVSTAHSRRARQ